MSLPHRLATLVALPLLLMAAPGLHAAVLCADTGLELRDALQAASQNGSDNEIRVTVGVKHYQQEGTSAVWSYSTGDARDLTLSGGWGPGCASQSQDPRLTRLSGGTFGTTLAFLTHSSSSAAITVRNLTLEYGRGRQYLEGAGLDVQASQFATPLVLVEQVVVRYNDEVEGAVDGAAVAVRVVQSASGIYTLRNLLVEDNLTRGLWLSLKPNAVAYLNNSTFVGNNTAVANVDTVAVEGSGGTVWIANNLMHDNGGSTDLDLESGPVTFLRNNHLQVLSGSPGSNLGMSSGDPMLTQGPDGWRRPRRESPLCDTGHAAPAGGSGGLDLGGGPRVLARVDRGALESDCDTLFRAGFQS